MRYGRSLSFLKACVTLIIKVKTWILKWLYSKKNVFYSFHYFYIYLHFSVILFILFTSWHIHFTLCTLSILCVHYRAKQLIQNVVKCNTVLILWWWSVWENCILMSNVVLQRCPYQQILFSRWNKTCLFSTDLNKRHIIMILKSFFTSSDAKIIISSKW